MSVAYRSRAVLLFVVVAGLTLGLAAATGVRLAMGGGSLEGLMRLAILGGAAWVFLTRADRLSLGVALIPFTGAVVPLEIGTSTQSSIVGALILTLLLVGVWCAEALIRRDLRIARSPLNAPLALLMVVWVLAMVNSDVERDPRVWVPPTWTVIQLGALGVTIASCAAMWLALNAGRQIAWVRLATWSFLGAGALAGAVFYAGLAARLPFVQFGGLFTMWVVVLAYGQALFNDRLAAWKRLGLLLLAGAWMYKALILQVWFFSGWAPPILAIVVVTWARSRLAGIVTTLLSALWIWLNFDMVYEVVYGGAEAKGDLTRLDIWTNAWEMVARFPLLGSGPAGYAVYFQSLFSDTGFAMSTHSNYWDVLLETGFLGAAIFAWLMAALVVVGLRACWRWRTGFEGGYAAAGLGGLAGLLLAMGLGDWLIPFVYNQTIAGFRYTVHSWVFLGFLGSLAITKVGSNPAASRRAGGRPPDGAPERGTEIWTGAAVSTD